MTELPPINLPPISGPSREECDYILGVYIRLWGDVEAAMAGLIRKLLDTDMTTSQIVLRALGDMRAHREIAAELGKHRLNTSDCGRLEKLLKRVKAAATRRNRIVHGKWTLLLEMGPPPRLKPPIAKVAKWFRLYEPSQQEEITKLHGMKNQKLNAAYRFWPADLRRDTDTARTLAEELRAFDISVTLKPPCIPLPVEW